MRPPCIPLAYILKKCPLFPLTSSIIHHTSYIIPLPSYFLQKMSKGVKTNVNARRKTSKREVCKLSSPGPDERMMFTMLWYYT